MDFETQDRRPEADELPRSGAPTETAPQEKPPVAAEPKKRRWPWVLLIVILILAAIAAAAYWLSGVHVRFERTKDSVTLIVETGKQETVTAEPTEPSEPAAYIGSGKTMQIAPSKPGVPNRPSSAEDALSLQELYETVMPCLVTVRAEHLRGSVCGIGVILSEDGFIITNAKAVDRALELLVTVNGGEPQEAVLVGSDASGDVAVLKIDAEGLTPAVFGDSDVLRVGDVAVAVDAPSAAGLSCTVSDGIISGIDRDVTYFGRQTTLIRTSIPGSGSMGGPLFNCYGQVVAFRTATYSRSYSNTTYEGMGNAIPVSDVKPIVDELMERGFVADRPSIGLSVEDLPERVRIYYGLPSGVYITRVRPGSGADKAGVREGDILTAVGDQPVTGTDVLEPIRDSYAAGDVIELTVYRGGEYLKIPVSLTQKDQSN